MAEAIAASRFGLLADKKILIAGVANHRSIAWAVAQVCAAHGALVGLTYQNDAFLKRVSRLADEINARLMGKLDVTQHAEIDRLGQRLQDEWGRVDGIVHAIAYADKEALSGRYIDTTPAQFEDALRI